MFKFTSIVFAIFACVGGSVSAGFLSGAPAVYSTGIVPSAYAAPPAVTKYATAYTAGPALTHAYATTSYTAASPYFSANPWTGYGASSLSAYATAPAHYTKFVAPSAAYPATYGAPVAAYHATYSAPAAYVGYAAPAHVGYAHPGYAQSAHTQSGYNAAPFTAYAAAAPSTLAAW